MLGEGDPVRPVSYPGLSVERTGLKDIYWCVLAYLTGTVWGVRQAKSVQVTAEPAVSCSESKNGCLLIALKVGELVVWRVIVSFPEGFGKFPLDERFGLFEGHGFFHLLQSAAGLGQGVRYFISS